MAFITEPLAGLVDITVIGRLGDAALLGGVVIGALVFDFIFSLAYFLRHRHRRADGAGGRRRAIRAMGCCTLRARVDSSR